MIQLNDQPLSFFQPTTQFRELILLNEIESNPRITQSQLAREAGIVPAMVNNYIKSFLKNNLISVEGNNRAMQYTLTPEGAKYKMDLLLSYFRETVYLYKNVKEEIKSKLNSYKEENIETIVIYGARETAEITLKAADELGIEVLGVVDGDLSQQGKGFFGRVIELPSRIEDYMPDAVVISSSGFQDEIYANIKNYEQMGIKIRKL